MTDAETIASLRASLIAAEAELLALTHRATTAEATVAALMADGAATLAALRDAAVSDAAAVCERMAQGHDRIASASSPAAEERHKGVAAALRLAADRIRSLAPQEPPHRPRSPADAAPIGPPVWSHEEFTAAVEAEREACAQIASREASAWGRHERSAVSSTFAGMAAAEAIYGAIRSRGGSR